MMMMMEINVLPFKILVSSSYFVLVEMVMEAALWRWRQRQGSTP
jgi:hypothetical protein